MFVSRDVVGAKKTSVDDGSSFSHTDMYNGQTVVVKGSSSSGAVNVYVNGQFYEAMNWTKFSQEGYRRNINGHQVTILSPAESQAKQDKKQAEKLEKTRAKETEKAHELEQKAKQKNAKQAEKEMRKAEKLAAKELKKKK